jgi:outer membrane protein insertion porin family
LGVSKRSFSGVARHALVLIVLALGLLLNGPLTAWADTFKVTDIRIEGLQRISAGTVFSLLPVKIGDSTTDEVTAKSIRALYASGFFEDVKVEREGTVLVVTVQERPTVAEIILSGLTKTWTRRQLRAALKEIGLAEGRVFDKAIFARIEQELKNQYFSRGKYGIEVQTTVSPLERNRVRVTIDIIEGLTARIKQINIIGNEAFPEKELLGLVQTRQDRLVASWYSARTISIPSRSWGGTWSPCVPSTSTGASSSSRSSPPRCPSAPIARTFISPS